MTDNFIFVKQKNQWHSVTCQKCEETFNLGDELYFEVEYSVIDKKYISKTLLCHDCLEKIEIPRYGLIMSSE